MTPVYAIGVNPDAMFDGCFVVIPTLVVMRDEGLFGIAMCWGYWAAAVGVAFD